MAWTPDYLCHIPSCLTHLQWSRNKSCYVLLFSPFAFTSTSLNINSWSASFSLLYIQNRIFSFFLSQSLFIHPQHLNLLETSWIKLYPPKFCQKILPQCPKPPTTFHPQQGYTPSAFLNVDSSINMKAFEIILGTWIDVNMQLNCNSNDLLTFRRALFLSDTCIVI